MKTSLTARFPLAPRHSWLIGLTLALAAQAAPARTVLASAPPPADAPAAARAPAARDFPLEGHTATLLPNGKVLVAGGRSRRPRPLMIIDPPPPDPLLVNAWLYDPARNTWLPAASMTSVHDGDGSTATLLPSGQVLMAGGGGATAAAELYDSVGDAWSPAAAPATPLRPRRTATLLPTGEVLMAGGEGWSNNGPRSFASAALYGPTGWSPAASMRTGRSRHAATLLPSGRVMVAGGDPSKLGSEKNIASAELYDPRTHAWSLAASMRSGRADFTMTLLPSGKVLAVGGDIGFDLEAMMSPTGSHVTASAELYDPRTNAWSPASPMKANPRTGHTATLLPSGMVLVAGGEIDVYGFATPSAELYDPRTDTWSSAGLMQLGRVGHTATLLPNGKVLVVGGGENGNSTPANNAELYDPVANAWSFTGPMADVSAAAQPPAGKAASGQKKP